MNTRKQNEDYASWVINNRDHLADCAQVSKYAIDIKQVCDTADKVLADQMNVQEARDVFSVNYF